MRLLIIGGTRFVGRALTSAALERGHTVTLFNRGNTNPDLFPQAETIHGDRDGDLHQLDGHTWDAVIDTCGYVPRVVEKSVQKLKDVVGHYTFISTISVYDRQTIMTTPGLDETAPLETLDDPTTEDVTGETYGGLKVLCERAAEAALPGRVLQIRPGLIVGPHDHTDRFTYWPVKVARGGQILAPPEDTPLQVVDVRDLAAFTLDRIEAGDTETYNVTGPAEALAYGTMLHACQAAAGAPAQVIHADEAFLLEHDVQPFADLPLWLPEANDSLMRTSIQKAQAAGLTFRPIMQTIQDTLAWYTDERGLEEPLRAGMPAEREAKILAEWQPA
jgi:2'-hydroxyisoflavone reductase